MLTVQSVDGTRMEEGGKKCLERMDGEWRARAFKDSVESGWMSFRNDCGEWKREREGEKVSECEANSNKEQEIERESSQTSRAQKTKVRILTSAAFHY